MKTKMKTTLFTLFFLFVLTTSVHAQDKYEYAIVNQMRIYNNTLEVTTSQTFEEFRIEKGDNLNVALLKKVEEMESKGWEVFNSAIIFTSSNYPYHTFYLRRKKE